jgi:hypothetical protein
MYDTVDQAHGPVPRTLAGIIQDARRSVCATAAPIARISVLNRDTANGLALGTQPNLSRPITLQSLQAAGLRHGLTQGH